MGLDAFTITKEIWENHSRLISCIMARLLGSRCLVSIQVKLVFRLRTKLMNRGGGEAALNTESSEEIYMMLTSKAIHFCFYVVVYFLGGGVENFVSDLHRVWSPWQLCCAYNRNDGGKSCSYVLCSVSGEIEGHVFFGLTPTFADRTSGPVMIFCIFFIIIFIFYH